MRPTPSARDGVRDRAMLHLCFAGGLRVSELGRRAARRRDAAAAGHDPRARQRSARALLTPLESDGRRAARLAGRAGPCPAPEVFVNARGQPLTRSGFEYILGNTSHTATTSCPSLSAKRVSPHVLRHTCALTVLQATKDLRKVSLWLGHAHMQTTEMYTRADPSVKLEALEAMIAPTLRSGRFRATDKLIASLTSRSVMRSTTPSK